MRNVGSNLPHALRVSGKRSQIRGAVAYACDLIESGENSDAALTYVVELAGELADLDDPSPPTVRSAMVAW